MAVDSALSSPLGPPACEKDAKALQFIEKMTRNADAVQERVLTEILSQNGGTEYSGVPVIKYEDLQPEIQRIANGDRTPILSAHPISEFSPAGERKLMPTIQEELDRRQLLYSLLMPVMNLYVPGLDKGKGLYFLFVKSETKTPGGLLARHPPTRPSSADSFQSMYTQMLCGLLEHNQVLRVGAVFASGLLRAIRFLQLNWPQLTHDIRTGTLNQNITDPSIRGCMARILKPDPDIADFVAEECSKDSWEGIITRIWPNTKYLDVIVTGAMAQYIPTLDYYSAGLPLACTMYASSECYFGLNLNPMCKPSEKVVDLADVEVGKEYELVITTYAGLYRYRVGDILRVTGFHNSAPQFHFVRRKNVLLSIDSDKTDEADFNTSVVEYTSYADTKTIPGHYVIYWELLARTRRTSLESLNSVYRQGRVADNSIGPLEIRVVRNGTFEELMDYAISRGASINQYKVPRCVSFTPIMELLDSRVTPLKRSMEKDSRVSE
ncbi:hypothetical protein NMG60_11019766 [Bertholletia excelsa]